jgi:hypothetical protein
VDGIQRGESLCTLPISLWVGLWYLGVTDTPSGGYRTLGYAGSWIWTSENYPSTMLGE